VCATQDDGKLLLTDVTTVVFDEADTLFDHSFAAMTDRLIDTLQYVPCGQK
jgi:superfamily II DNA/RNA helicase